ncbi:MAG: hypothetical protein V4562_03210 [Pseudomonadota bacterium]
MTAQASTAARADAMHVLRTLAGAALAAALVGCGGGQTTASDTAAAPAPTEKLSPLSAAINVRTPQGTVSGRVNANVGELPALPQLPASASPSPAVVPPPITTTSADTTPLSCSPKQVVTNGGWSSCNMQWLGRFPIPGLTIGGRKVGDTFYVTNWTTGFYAFDVKNPENPKLLGKLFLDGAAATAVISAVENEDPAVNGKVAVLSRTTYQDAIVVDTSNPTAMKVMAQIPGAQAHTHTCLNDCQYSYGSTTGAIVDLRNPAKPVLLPKKWTDIVGVVSPHDITEVRPGLVVTASDPAVVLDTTDPANPKKLFELPRTASENPLGRPGPEQTGRIGHNNWWPRQGADKFFMGLSEGAYVGICDIHPNDGRSLYLYDTTGWQQKQTFTVQSRYTLVRGNADTGINGGPALIDSNGNPSAVEAGIQGCSVHWFDPHPQFNDGGLLAMAAFSHGMRLLQVQPNGKMEQLGYFVAKGATGLATTVDVRWISDRVMYVMDVTSGTMDVVKYTGPLAAK